MKRVRVRKISRHTLAQDLLFDFVIKEGHKCFRCGQKLRRKDFTIEHKVPWRKTADPSMVFYDIENIAYSHAACNYKEARKPNKLNRTKEEDRVVRLARKKAAWAALDKTTRQAHRRRMYERYGQ